MQQLADFLRERRAEIVARWERSARELPSAQKLSRERLIDFVPALLDRIATHVEQLAAGREGFPEHSAAKKHARDRLDDHYSLEDMVEELAMLRAAIIQLWRGKDERSILNRAIDQSIVSAVLEFTSMQNRETARLFEEMRRAVELRDRILAVVSHDLRNPLGAIDLGAALLLKNKSVRMDPIARKQTETIQRSAGRMDRLISDLLDMSSIQAGRLSLHREDIQIEPLVTEVADAHEPNAIEKGIKLERDIELSDTIVHGDHDRLMQVLSNIIGNAIKFCRNGDTVTISAMEIDTTVRIGVSDTGPGIEADELAHVFELYWHGKAREHRSTGLGLFIARGIVEAHGGRLWVESAPGDGTSFFMTLPRAK